MVGGGGSKMNEVLTAPQALLQLREYLRIIRQGKYELPPLVVQTLVQATVQEFQDMIVYRRLTVTV